MSNIVLGVNVAVTMRTGFKKIKKGSVPMSGYSHPPDKDDLERAAEQLEAPIANLVGDYEELEVRDKPQAKGIYLLPNLLTSAALFCGFYAIIASMQADYYSGAVAIFVAMIFDGMDGRVARFTNTSSAFGAQYDSLADMVSFGIAPALLTFNWTLTDLGKLGWVAAFIYAACAALRLARFNSQLGMDDSRHFTGLASPAAAVTAAGLVWMSQTHGWTWAAMDWVHALLLTGLGFLMISRIPYSSFKFVTFDHRVPFVRMLLVVGLFGLIALDPPIAIWTLSLGYSLSGPLLYLRRAKGGSEEKNETKQNDQADFH